MVKIIGWKRIRDVKNAWKNRLYPSEQLWIAIAPATKYYYVDYYSEKYPLEYERKNLGVFKTKTQAIKYAIRWMKKHPTGLVRRRR